MRVPLEIPDMNSHCVDPSTPSVRRELLESYTLNPNPESHLKDASSNPMRGQALSPKP